MSRRLPSLGRCLAGLLGLVGAVRADELPLVDQVELQPLAAQVRRLVEAEEMIGAPLSAADRSALDEAMELSDPARAVAAVQRVLDRHCLVGVSINPEARVTVQPGPAAAELAEGGWRSFLVKIRNEAGVTGRLEAFSPNARAMGEFAKPSVPEVVHQLEHGAPLQSLARFALPEGNVPAPGQRWGPTPSDLHGPPAEGTAGYKAADLWLDLRMCDGAPLQPRLSGLRLEYRILSLYSRDRGAREAKLWFNLGQGTQNLGFRNDVDILFRAAPAVPLTLRVRDENGEPCVASLVIRDAQGRIYPSQVKRLAPDLAFQPQIYRGDGETIGLPPGAYTVEYTRGPEYAVETASLSLGDRPQTLECRLRRWIDPSRFGWWSGDSHIHAAGCAHYDKPSEGVQPADMMRQCLGEDLKVGCALTWGPCFDYQKRFFTGRDDAASAATHLLHYDIEVSGFGSANSGHLCLLRLKQEIYPGGDSDQHWPSLGLTTLKWAKSQGAVAGPAHSGWGLAVETAELPNYVVPPLNSIGANEYVVDVTHLVPGPDGRPVPAVDFMGIGDTPYVWELNMWYQTLNVGYRTRVSGETDFPCIYQDRVGMGRSYVKVKGELTYDAWCEGIREGRSYVSDGRSHLLDFTVGDRVVGEQGSEVRLVSPGTVRVEVRAAAWLDEQRAAAWRARPYNEAPYWDLERARIGSGRGVPVEVVVNGYPVARQTIPADGTPRRLSFDLRLERSSWVAVRILPSSHTNPIFVLVGGKPVRASKRSARWCQQCVDRCWQEKESFIKPAEQADARLAYEHARQAYRERLAECDVE